MKNKPKWKYPLDTKEGRRERAVWTFREGERKGMPVANVMYYLKEWQGLSDTEIMDALNEATGGELVRSALGAN